QPFAITVRRVDRGDLRALLDAELLRERRSRVSDRRAHAALPHPSGLKTRSVDAGYLASFAAGRRGRATSSPPQLGQRPWSARLAQSRQNVHSKEQITASADSGGR